MSPVARLLWRRLERRAARLRPELRSTLIRAFRDLTTQLSDDELVRLARSGSMESAIEQLLNDTAMERAFQSAREVARNGVLDAARTFAHDLPQTVTFDLLNPMILHAVQELETRVITGLAEDVRQAVRQAVARSLQAGETPQILGRHLRSIVGLAPNQEAAVANFRRLLETGNRAVLSRALRDRRFDALLRRSLDEGLSVGQVDRMTSAYARRMVAHNAATHAQTLAMDATRLGQRLTWEKAAADGIVERGNMVKRWSGVLDDRERDEHVAMEGETVPFDERFSNGEMVPGDSTYNCRCIAVYTTVADPLSSRRAGAGARGISAAQLRLAAMRARAA